MEDDRIITLQSQEMEIFKVECGVAKMSETIKNLLQDVEDANEPIPLPNVNSRTLQRVLTYCKHYYNPNVVVKPATEGEQAPEEKRIDDICPWDLEFCKMDQPELFELILGANYLDIKDLLDVTCKTVANMIKGKTPEEIRKTFNIPNDFTPEEEEQIRKENEWAEEK